MLLLLQVFKAGEGSALGDWERLRFPPHSTKIVVSWTLVIMLIDKPHIDLSLVEYNENIWIFASSFLFFSAYKYEEFEIRYEDTHGSYGAWNEGPPFLHDDKLYHVDQPGKTCEQKVQIYQVEALTTEKFEEVEVPFFTKERKKGQNSWNSKRYHHLDLQFNGIYSTYFLGASTWWRSGGCSVCSCFEPHLDLPSVWSRPHIDSKLNRAFSRFNRGSLTCLSWLLRLSTCAASSLLFACFVVSAKVLKAGKAVGSLLATTRERLRTWLNSTDVFDGATDDEKS
ncbi:hypothetical protein L7F22_003859 [Adiantum nelumboides]|nr:hypothetical protein [Adiantum nelumboides]